MILVIADIIEFMPVYFTISMALVLPAYIIKNIPKISASIITTLPIRSKILPLFRCLKKAIIQAIRTISLAKYSKIPPMVFKMGKSLHEVIFLRGQGVIFLFFHVPVLHATVQF